MNTFSKQPKIQQKALQKALRSPFIGKHGKRKETLLKEEIYKNMQDKILDKVDELIDAQIKVALNGNDGEPDPRVIESLLNRVFGKPNQEIAIKNTTNSMGKILDEIEKEDNNTINFSWQK